MYLQISPLSYLLCYSQAGCSVALYQPSRNLESAEWIQETTINFVSTHQPYVCRCLLDIFRPSLNPRVILRYFSNINQTDISFSAIALRSVTPPLFPYYCLTIDTYIHHRRLNYISRHSCHQCRRKNLGCVECQRFASDDTCFCVR